MFAIQRPQPLNPYIAGRALREERGFFGRSGILELAAKELLAPAQNPLVIYGQRRIGKTSILLQLQARLPAHLFVPVYFDLMDRAASPLGHVLFELACAMSGAAAMPPPEQPNFDDAGTYFRLEFVPRFCDRMAAGVRPVLLIDEFDTGAGLAPSAAGRSFYPFLRRMVGSEPRLGFLFTASRKTDSGFEHARYLRVPVLDSNSSRDLILCEGRAGSLQFQPAAIERVLKLTAGHPYLTQLICQSIWEATHSRGTVETRDVDAAAVQALEAGGDGFEWIWEGFQPAEKVMYAAIASVTATQPDALLETALQCLRASGIGVLTREMELAPEDLVESEFLEMRNGRYRATVDLLRRWVATNKPLGKLKDEMDRVVPLADTLYQSGDGFYRRGNLESSHNLLQQALVVNPNHLKARLLVAQVVAEQGRLDEAIVELEQAYRRDQAGARQALVRTLILRAEELERKPHLEGALSLYQRVLDIWPEHPEAGARWVSIWRERGDQAFAQDKLEEAAAAYSKIGAPDLTGKVAARKRALRMTRLTAGAHVLFKDRQWAEAAKAYRELEQLEPRESAWGEAAVLCETEHRLDTLYVEATHALQAEQWDQARDGLVQVLATRPEYRDSATLLVRAITAPALEKEPVVGPFLLLYCKVASVLAVCIAAGLLRVYSGDGDLGTRVGFYLGTAVVLAFVLALVEFGSQLLSDRSGNIQVTLPRPKDE